MGNLTHTVSGGIASFRSAARVPIESLRCHFLPIQEGTGDPSPDNVRPISGWQGVEIYQNNIYLPNEYQRVEYLESSGTQWIDTAIYYNTNDKIIIDFMSVSDNNDHSVFGIYQDGTHRCELNLYSGRFRFDIDDQNFKYNHGNKYHIVRDANNWYIGKEKVYSSVITSTNNNIDAHTLLLFGRWYNAPTKMSKIKVYNYIYERNNNVILNFIPCYRKYDNKPGMYDTVSQTFFTNQGTGEFICGPDVGKKINVSFPGIGKNLLNKNMENKTVPAGNVVVFNRTLASAKPNGNDIYLSAGTYTFSSNLTASLLIINNSSGQPIGGTKNNVNLYTFTVTEDGPIGIVFMTSQTLENGILSYEYQIEKGSTATAYEPFNNTVYGGYIDLANGELIQEWSGVTVTGIEDWTVSKVLNKYRASILPEDAQWPTAKDNGQIFFDYIASYREIAEGVGYLGNNGKIFTYIDSTLDDTEKWKAYLAEHPLQIVYQLENPITYQLTSIQLKTLLDQNNIWSNTNDITEVSYAIHDSAPIRATRAKIMANEPHIESINGNIASFNTDMIAPLNEAKVYFNPVQEGTGDPSPDNVRPISGWTGVEATRTGKSTVPFLVESKYSQTNYNGFAGWSNAWKVPNRNAKYTYSVYIDNTNSTDVARASVWFRNEDNTSYVDSTSLNGTVIQAGSAGISCLTVDMSSRPNTYYLCFGMKINNATASQPMVEYGDTKTEYETYNDTTIPVDWSSEAGTLYGGYIDLISGELVQTHAYQILNNANYWKEHPTMTRVYVYDGPTFPIDYSKGNAAGITCTCFPAAGGTSQYNMVCRWLQDANDNIFLAVRYASSVNLTLNDLQTLSSENKIALTYELATPITHQLTPTQLKSLIGTNNIWSNTNGPIELKYWTH